MSNTNIVTPKPVALTIEQLQAMTWGLVSHSVDEVQCDQDTVVVGIEYDDEGKEVNVEREYFNRYAYGEATMRSNENPAIEISFTWQASHENQNSYADSFDFDLEVYGDGEIKLTGATLIDDDGDEVSGSDYRWELSEIMKGCEWEGIVRHDLPTPETEEIEMSGEGEEFVVERDNAPALKFKGELVASATSKHPYNDGGRWTNLYLYKTAGGKFICHQENVTCWQGERDKHKADVCSTNAEIIAWFGQGRVAKHLYENANIENVESID